MNWSGSARLACAAVAIATNAAAQAAGPAPTQVTGTAAGHWEGRVTMKQQQIPISVDLTKNASGAWIGSMVVTGTTSVDVPLTAIGVTGFVVRFTAALPTAALFEATLSANADTLSGEASNDQGGVPFRLTRAGDAHVKIPAPSSALSKAFEGMWEGSVAMNGATLRLALRLIAAPDGTATATLVSLDQGNAEIPATTVTIQGNRLSVELRAISASYGGTLGATGEITGEFSQGPGSVSLNFKRVDARKP